MFKIFVFITFISANVSFRDKIGNDFPWIGTLRLTANVKKQAITVITVIQQNVAIANAFDIATLFDKQELRPKTIASFLNRNRDQWECKVADVIFHPEYNVVTKNTIALVFLEPIAWSFWEPINLPRTGLSVPEDAHFINFADKTRNRLILLVQSTKSVNRTECDAFYRQEELDLKWLRPVHYSCYSLDKEDTCLNDAGMVLAMSENDVWTLLGISIYGPGCSLPARFIDILPYKPWIRHYVPIRDDDDEEIIAMGTRRFATKYQSGEITGETFDDRDSIIMNKIDDDSIVLKYKSKFETYEAYGDCDQSNLLVYEEKGKINMNPTATAKAVYSVSLYDIRVLKIDCIKLDIHCKAWSGLQVSYSKGFEQEDWSNFVQVIPNIMDSNDTNSTQRILYVEDEWMNYVESETISVWVKFEIVGSATLRARYYGNTRIRPIVTTKATTTTTTVAPDQTGEPSQANDTEHVSTRRPRIYALPHLRRTKTPTIGLLRTGKKYTNLYERSKIHLAATTKEQLSVLKSKETSRKRENKYNTRNPSSLIHKHKKKTTRRYNTAIIKSNGNDDKDDKQSMHSKINNIFTTSSRSINVNRRKTTKKTRKNRRKMHSNIHIIPTTTNKPLNDKDDEIIEKNTNFKN